MSLGIDIKPTGLKEALRTINSINPKLRKEYGKQIRTLGQVVVDAITPLIPSEAPSRGFDHAGRTGWNKRSQTRQVVVKTNTRKARKRNIAQGAQYETIGTVTVGTKGAALAIADMAGRAGGSRGRGGPKGRPNFAPLMSEKIGRGASRFVWAGGEKAIPEFQRALEPVIKEVIYLANQELMKVNR